ncbi:WYL domain-containing protein, partial [Candidatus Parcubacteria bacterium]
MIRCLERGPATRAELISAALQNERTEDIGESVLRKRFENDMRRLREHFLLDIRYDRSSREYDIESVWMPLVDLSDENLQTLAWLQEEFGPDSPQHEAVSQLIDRIRLLLGVQRAAEVARRRWLLSLGLKQRDEHQISQEVWERLQRALHRHCLVEFSYASPQQSDSVPRRHTVEFYRAPYFEEGHYYIRGYCRHTEGPLGRYNMHRYFDYRVDRISELRLLPDKLGPEPPRARRYGVKYELAPRIARKGISRSRWIQIEDVQMMEDGRALVSGTTEDIFRARQFLMRYREHCRVLGGPELLLAMRETVRK